MLPGIRIVVVTGSFIRAFGGDGECVILASKRFAADEVDPAPPSLHPAQPSQGVAAAGLSKEGSET